MDYTRNIDWQGWKISAKPYEGEEGKALTYVTINKGDLYFECSLPGILSWGASEKIAYLTNGEGSGLWFGQGIRFSIIKGKRSA